MKTTIQFLMGISACILLATNAWAGDLAIPNTFTSDTPAVAAEVNGNFSAVETEVDDNNSRIAALEALVATLQTALAGKADVGHSHAQADITNLSSDLSTHTSQISGINNSEIMALNPYVTIANDSRGPIATFSGLNLQLVNGTGTTNGTPNGLGNFIIGYDLARTITETFFCSFGTHTDQTTCETNGYTWAVSHKTGSHYLIVGDRNNYSQFAGQVVGQRNTSNREYASVSGGRYNTASGPYASVSGGARSTASGIHASVSGGFFNIASGNTASVSGGNGNIASGNTASISGGVNNIAEGTQSSILGGGNLTASTNYQTIPALP